MANVQKTKETPYYYYYYYRRTTPRRDVPPYVILIRRTRVYDTNAARNVARRLRVRIYNPVISGPGFRRDVVGEGGVFRI